MSTARLVQRVVVLVAAVPVSGDCIASHFSADVHCTDLPFYCPLFASHSAVDTLGYFINPSLTALHNPQAQLCYTSHTCAQGSGTLSWLHMATAQIDHKHDHHTLHKST
jgi:hypothetical protein